MLFNYFNNNNTILNYFKNIENPIILHFDEMRGETPNRMHLHSHDFVEIFYFFKGEGFFVTPNEKYQVCPHDIVVVDSHKQHTEYSSDVNHSLHHFILALDNVSITNNSDVALLMPHYKRCFHHSFENEDNPFFHYFNQLYHEFIDPQQGYNIKAQAIVLQMLIDLMRLQGIEHIDANENNIPAVMRAKDYIDKNFSQDISLDDLAACAYVSKYHLSRKFKEAYHCSPIQYLTIRRIQEAKQFLRNTSKPISEIAQLTGFNLPVYFTKIFKQEVGMTPHKYRTLS